MTSEAVYSRAEVTIDFSRSQLLVIDVALVRLKIDGTGDVMASKRFELRLDNDLLAAYRFSELSRNMEYASHEYRVASERKRHVDGMIYGMVEAVLAIMCNDSGLNRADVRSM